MPFALRIASLLIACTTAIAGSAAAQGATPLPAAPHGPTVDRYFGTELPDPYRGLEDLKSPETQQWLRAASDHAASTLARLPGRDALAARLAELEAATTARIGRIVRLPGQRYVYEKRGASDNQFKLVMRQGLKGAERVLVDPEALSRTGGAPVAVNHFSASPDGRYLAYGLSSRGSEAAVLHLLNTRTLRAVGTPIDRADFGVARWSPDGKRFSFNRLSAESPDPKSKYERSAAWLLEPGQAVATARELLGPGTRSLSVAPREIPTVLFTDDGRWLIGLLEDGVRREARVAIASASDVLRGGAPRWKTIIERDDAITDFAYVRGTLYAATYKDAPRYRYLAAPIERFAAGTAPTVVPAGHRVLGLMVAARDGLYYEAREGNAKQLWKLPHGPRAQPQPVALPLQGSFALRRAGGVWAAHARLDGVLIALEDWTHAAQLYAVDARGGVHNTGLQPAGPFDTPPDIEVSEALVPSHDGERVPLSIVHKKGLARDAQAPTLLLGYAAYGFTMEPRFSAQNLAWLERGGVLAFANPRGSGVFGQAWYEAGKQTTKPNTWRDMIACAEYLIAQRVTQPARLAIEGTSAGGITSGRAATERPELFAAVVARVGVLDALRSELEPNGPPNIPEFGTHRTEAGFRALRAMSTYHHIRDGVRYPAVLLTHGVNDPRVTVWQSAKAAARFAAAAASVADGRPVLLRLDYDAGHGVGNTKLQAQRERADIYAFLLWQMGVPAFQPPATTP